LIASLLLIHPHFQLLLLLQRKRRRRRKYFSITIKADQEKTRQTASPHCKSQWKKGGKREKKTDEGV
jgi:hypothetical protein